ncbi:MAG: protein-glutamate O-methyltransferase CheR [Candidatus Tectimicrobiota bacterium]
MSARPLPSVPPALSEADSVLWQALVQQRCGLHFSASRLRLLRQSLWERLRLTGIATYGAYYQHLTGHPAGAREWAALLELLLNHETSFWRHQPSFEALTGHVLPALLQAAPRHTPLAMWSAGCAMGQEPYSLAMAYLDTLRPYAGAGLLSPESPLLPPAAVKILGTDISHQALERARRGRYKAHEMRHLSATYRQRYFLLTSQDDGPVYQVGPQVQTLVEFAYVNLHDFFTYPPPYAAGTSWGFEVIFCQNVLIYFSPENRLAIVQRLCQCLRPGGYAFLGPADILGLKLPGLRAVRFGDALLYQRLP